MKLLANLLEMTMKAGSLSAQLGRYMLGYVHDRKSYQHVGDIEHLQVLLKEIKGQKNYLLMDSDTGVGFFELEKNEILALYIEDKYRRQGIAAKMIWFLKKHEGYSKLTLSDVHSPDTVEMVKKLSKKFDVSWTKGNEKVKYDPEEIDKFYSHQKPTGWKIMLENDGDFSDWPRFFNGPDPRCHYDWLIE